MATGLQPSGKAPGNGAHTLQRPAARTAVLALAALCLLHEGRAAESSTPVIAIWREHRLLVSYHSASTRYSCAELVSKVTAILRAVGVRSDVQVQANCSNFAPVQSLQLTLQHPVVATAENVEAVTTFDPVQRLLAEIRHESLPTAADLAKFPAVWRTVRLSRIRDHRLRNGDCQLLRTLNEQVFPQLEVRVPKGGFRCPDDASVIQPKVVAEALIPIAG